MGCNFTKNSVIVKLTKNRGVSMSPIIIKSVAREQCVSSGMVIELLSRHVNENVWQRRTGYYSLGDHIRVRKFSTNADEQSYWFAYEVDFYNGWRTITRLLITPAENLKTIELLAHGTWEGFIDNPSKILDALEKV